LSACSKLLKLVETRHVVTTEKITVALAHLAEKRLKDFGEADAEASFGSSDFLLGVANERFHVGQVRFRFRSNGVNRTEGAVVRHVQQTTLRLRDDLLCVHSLQLFGRRLRAWLAFHARPLVYRGISLRACR